MLLITSSRLQSCIAIFGESTGAAEETANTILQDDNSRTKTSILAYHIVVFSRWRLCNQMCINFTVVSQARHHKSVNTQLVPHGGRSSVNPGSTIHDGSGAKQIGML